MLNIRAINQSAEGTSMYKSNAGFKSEHRNFAAQTCYPMNFFQKILLHLIRKFTNELSQTEHNQLFYNQLLFLALKGMGIGTGHLINHSGEERLIQNLYKTINKNDLIWVVFDVGANIGKYSSKILSQINHPLELHIFEPSRHPFEQIQNDYSQKNNVIMNRLGLGDIRSKKILFSNKIGSGLASVYKRELDYLDISFDLEEEIEIITLDEYCREKKIEIIHFLKLDVEGNELAVLRGSKQMLEEKRIINIQFEFGGANISSRTYFFDFWKLLSETYHIYRVFQSGMTQITKYQETHEQFRTTIFLATLKVNKSVNSSINL